MKERVGDEKLIIINVAVRGINVYAPYTNCTGPVHCIPYYRCGRCVVYTDPAHVSAVRQNTHILLTRMQIIKGHTVESFNVLSEFPLTLTFIHMMM